MRTLTIVALLSLSAAFNSAIAQDRSADVQAILDVVDQFMDSRTQDDATAYGAVLLDEVDYLATRGEMISGKEDMMAATLENSRTVGGDRSMTFSTMRFIRDDVVLADGIYLIRNRLDGGRDSTYYTSWVVVKDNGEWKVSAIRNMQPTQAAFAPTGPVEGPPQIID